MPISVFYTDKFLAGVNHSFTITSDEGLPQAEVTIGEAAIPCRVLHMQNPKYKVSFMVPADSVGKELTLKLTAGATTIEEKQQVVAG